MPPETRIAERAAIGATKRLSTAAGCEARSIAIPTQFGKLATND